MNRALQFRRRLGGAGAAVLVILFLAFFLAFRYGTETVKMSARVAHTQDVLSVIARARQEDATWAYLWTRDSQLPELFRDNHRRLMEVLNRLRTLTSDEPEQQKLLDELAPILTAHVDLLDHAMGQSAATSASSAPNRANPLVIAPVLHRVSEIFDRLESHEHTLLEQRSIAFQKNASETRMVIFAAGFITFSICLIGGYLIQREVLMRASIEAGLRHAQELLGGEYEIQRSELGHTMEDLHARIRARQQAEDELRSLNQELEKRVDKRTAELLESNHELEAFSYSVSHDLRAPLRHMDGYSRILQQEYGPQLPEGAQHYLDRVRGAATHMSDLVEGLLQLSRIGRQVLQRRMVCANDLLEEAKAEVLPEAGNRTIHWEVAALPEVEADPVLLRQVFSNLLSNAIKFTRKASHAVIEVGSREEAGEIVVFVRDNGAGFDPRFADKLFGVFQRLHRQDEFEGSGIGLATVQRIVHKRGGRVWAESQVGQGATFYFSHYRLPNWTGLEALQELRQTGRDIPFLLVTGTLGEEAAVDCIKQGVTDYILKDRMSRLPIALHRAIGEKALREEAKQSQIALLESESRARLQFTELDQLYRSLPLSLSVFDRQLRFLRVNDAVSKVDGIPVAAHAGLSLREVAPDFAGVIEKYLRKVFQTGEPVANVDMRGGTLHEPGAVRNWLGSFYPQRAEDGTISAVTLLALDITERKIAEEALNISESRNRDLVEHAIYGISRVAADGTFLDENPAFLSILGCTSAKELHALNLMRDVFRFPERHAELMASCREHGEVHGAESEWRRCDGGIVAVRLHVRVLSIPNHAGAIEIIAEDVTELRAMERQLRQAQKFEAIGQLAGGIAHDFNNVVGAILGWAELGLEQNRTNPQVAERFARIREQGERAAALTRELLTFARRQVLQPQIVDVNAITSGLVSFLDKVIARDIELKVITAPVDAVKADPTQLEQVLMNLCLNARDAMPKGGRLLIETETVELDDSYCRFYPYVTAGRYVVLSVSDTGMGMDSETRERIFEPFFTTKERGKGTGMGLATAYGIIKQHGGFIHVYSEPGEGSLFRVYLPAHAGVLTEGALAKARLLLMWKCAARKPS